MAWTLKFWKSSATPPDAPVTWNYGTGVAPSNVPASQVTDITNYINSIAAISTTAAGRLNAYGQDIRIGYNSGDVGQAVRGPIDDYILIDLAAARTLYFFNSLGQLVPGDVRLTIMHELAHNYLPGNDPSHNASQATMNGADFDFRGPVIDEQNAIAQNAGLTNQIQTSYYATVLSSEPLFSSFAANYSYSHGNTIDTTRLGGPGSDNIDHSNNTIRVVDVLFGLGGNDTINGGGGSDYLYGGEDDDTFIGSKGDDLFHGGGTRNSDGGALVLKDDGIDTADYSAATTTEFIKITTDVTVNAFHSGAIDAANRLLIQQSGTGNGTATIISVEKVKGTAGVDTFEVTQLVAAQLAKSDIPGSVRKGGLAEVDLAGNDKPGLEGDLIDATKMKEKVVIDLDPAGGFIRIDSDAQSDAERKVKVLNAERAWGGEKDDKIKGSDEANELKGGKGDDRLEGRGGDDKLEGGEGKDELTGGAGNDILIGGAGDDQIWGGELNATSAAGDGNDTVTYMDETTAVNITFNGTGVSPSLIVTGGAIGTDTLHFVDSIIGTSQRDTLRIVGSIAADTNLTVDAAGGQNPNASDTINLSAATAGTTLFLDQNGNGTVSTAGGGTINLVGFHTWIIASAMNDTIFDFSSGHKNIDGGLGNDVISIAESSGSATLIGGEGNDNLTGGAGNDLLVGYNLSLSITGYDVWSKPETNILDGGAGSDILISIGDTDILLGGAGHDYISVANGDAFGADLSRIDGGSGSDVIDMMPKTETYSYMMKRSGASGPDYYKVNRAYILFPEASGNDKVLGQFFIDPSGAGTDTPPGGVKVDINGASVSDFKLIWNVTYNGDYYFKAHGDLVLLNTKTGDSIFFPNVYGELSGFGGEFQGFSAPIWIVTDEVVPSGDSFVDNFLSYFPIVLGDTSAYDVAEAAFEAAQASNGAHQGGPGDDRLAGGLGNDELSGGAGDDVFTASPGNDTISGGDGKDTIEMSGSRENYLFAGRANGLAIVTDRSGRDGVQSLSGVEEVYFAAEGRTYAIEDLVPIIGTENDDALLAGSAGDNTIIGLDGNDTLRGNGGDDLLDGGSGSDVARYAGRLSDFTIYRDLQGTLNVVDAIGSEGRDKLVGIETLYFAGDGSTLSVSDVPALGTAGDDLINGSERNDILFGQDGDDVLTGGSGINLLYGGLGNDSYVVDVTSQQVSTIVDNQREYTPESGAFWAGLNTLILTGVEASDLRFVRQGSRYQDLIVSVVGVAGSITIENQFASGITLGTVETLLLRAANGSEADLSYLLNGSQFLQATAGNDLQVGTQYDDVLESSAGDDTMIGLDGADLYQVGAGGMDVIDDRGIGTDRAIMPPWKGPPESEPARLSEDTIAFDFWINPGDVVLTRSGLDLIITVVGSEGSTTVRNQFLSEFYYAGLPENEWSNFDIVADQPLSMPGIERFEFGDGTVWSRSDVAAMVNSGGSQGGSKAASSASYGEGADKSGETADSESQSISEAESTGLFSGLNRAFVEEDAPNLEHYTWFSDITNRADLMMPMIV